VLEDFLDKKPLYYDEIDYERMPRVYRRIKEHFSFGKIIHIIGTNGKGTTGRFLATALSRSGFNTGHYTSPHILTFNERIWFNEKDVSMEELEETHKKLLSVLTQEEADSLSYFEYTTLLAMLYFSHQSDYIILEAGLGGCDDATAVFEKELTLVTPIDKDHEAFLGRSIDAIARKKLGAIQKAAIIAKQSHGDVYEVLRELQESRGFVSYDYKEFLEDRDRDALYRIAKHEKLPEYLRENLSMAIAALNYLQLSYRVEDFYNARLFGRLTKLNENIIVDVGHNLLAAKSIFESLKPKKYILIYNSYKDKNYKEILSVLKPIIEYVELIDVYNNRIEESCYIQEALDLLEISYRKFEQIQEDKSYLVFGSFSVVEAFLKEYRG
jgi:dihydrofolate synthase/folylpolyglutamate synthase